MFRSLARIYKQNPFLQDCYRWLVPRWLRFQLAKLLAPFEHDLATLKQFDVVALNQPLDRLIYDVDEAKTGSNGVNIVGFFDGEFGIAESARQYATALISHGVPVSIVNVDVPDLPHSRNDKTFDRWYSMDLKYDVSIVCVNPDWWSRAIESVGAERLRKTHVIGIWFWELSELPDSWVPYLDDVDEIVVASQFIADAISSETSKPVTVVPLPVFTPQLSGIQRSDLGLPEDKTIFLSSFDFNSFLARKNPLAVVAAFREAFPCDIDSVMLLIKTSNGKRHLDALRKLVEAAGDDPRIKIVDQVLEAPQMRALQSLSDFYISLHRSEGFGLGLAECMSQGIPVIGTAWSGNMDFMNRDNSYLVEFDLIPVREGEYPHFQGQVWAEPRIESAVRALRDTISSDSIASQKKQMAQKDIAQNFNYEVAALALIERVASIRKKYSSD